MMAARASSTLPDQYLRFINTEPINLFFQARSDLFVHELVAATPAHLRGKTIIEVTEKSVIEDFERVREVVARLREQGFRIAIDDAGAGYSGLQTVVEIEPDFMKLDMSLLRNIETSKVKQRLVVHAARLLPRRRHRPRGGGRRDDGAARHGPGARRARTPRASCSRTRARRTRCRSSSSRRPRCAPPAAAEAPQAADVSPRRPTPVDARPLDGGWYNAPPR